MKRGVALFGLLGLLGTFLPLLPGVSLFDLRAFDALPVYLTMAAFAIPMLVGWTEKATAAVSGLALACFGYVLYKFGFDTFDLIWHASIGGKLMGVAAVGGFVSSLGALATSSRR